MGDQFFGSTPGHLPATEPRRSLITQEGRSGKINILWDCFPEHEYGLSIYDHMNLQREGFMVRQVILKNDFTLEEGKQRFIMIINPRTSTLKIFFIYYKCQSRKDKTKVAGNYGSEA